MKNEAGVADADKPMLRFIMPTAFRLWLMRIMIRCDRVRMVWSRIGVAVFLLLLVLLYIINGGIKTCRRPTPPGGRGWLTLDIAGFTK